MKKINYILIFLLIPAFIISGCKKKKDDPPAVVPGFTVTATQVNLNTGDIGLQFFAKCHNDDVKMTKAIITDPIGATNITFNLNGNYAVKNEIFGLQAADEAYLKKIGTWSFVFIGNRTSNGVAFTASSTLSVSK